MTKVIVVAAAAVVSFMLAAAGWALRSKLGILTLGMRVSNFLVPSSPSASIFAAIVLQIAADFVFWFGLIWGLYWLLRRLGRKLSWDRERDQ